MLRETQRVLRPGGFLVITTPNVACLDNLVKLACGWNIFYPYSCYSIYSRHHREYTARELVDLLQRHNFRPALKVNDCYPHPPLYRWLTRWGPLRWRRDTLFVLAQAAGSVTWDYPEWLYNQRWAAQPECPNRIVMGRGESLQLGPGWHAFEDWPPGIRWTSRQATAFLKPLGGETTFGFLAHAGPVGVQGQVWNQG